MIRLFLTFFLAIILTIPAQAMVLIRDAEIETTLKNIFEPVLQTLPAQSQNIKLYIIADPSVNAFVTGGQNIFIHTGLIEKLQTPEQLAGVLAHELGHITGGHLVKSRQAASESSIAGLFAGALIGIAAAASGGAGGALAGGLLAAQQITAGGFNQFSRTQEASADQAALGFLKQSHIGYDGLFEVMEILSEGQFGLKDYMLSHPLTKERIALLKNNIIGNPSVQKNILNSHDYQRMQAKISAFLNAPDFTLSKNISGAPSDIQNLYKSIAYHKKGKGHKAYETLVNYLNKNPNDHFMQELAGQIAFETARPKKAVLHYSNIFTKIKHPLIDMSYAQALIATEDNKNIRKAIPILKQALIKEALHTDGFKNLAIAYQRLGDVSLSDAASSQYFFLKRHYHKAQKYANKALTTLPKGSSEYIKMEDILLFSNHAIKRNGK